MIWIKVIITIRGRVTARLGLRSPDIRQHYRIHVEISELYDGLGIVVKRTFVVFAPHFSEIVDVALVAGQLGVFIGRSLTGDTTQNRNNSEGEEWWVLVGASVGEPVDVLVGVSELEGRVGECIGRGNR